MQEALPIGSSCLCGCGRTARNGSGYHLGCAVECQCGCGGRARYAYAPGHQPKPVDCLRCGKSFRPMASEGGLCSQCRRHVRAGGPLERDGKLIHSRQMQARAPEGRRWCSGCNQYRLLKFFTARKAESRRTGVDKFYGRCKPCHRKQLHASGTARKYQLSPEQYQTIKDAQGGKCAICQVATGASRALAVDHDHKCCPGKTSCGRCVRGLLCSNCNNALGFFRDDPEAFLRAARYLTDPPAQRLSVARLVP